MGNNSRLFFLITLTLSLIVSFSACSPHNTASKADTVSENYGYDAGGRLIWKTTPGGDKVEYKYDSQGRVSHIISPDTQIKYAYDERNNITLIEDKTGKTEYHYDSLNRPIEVVYQHSPKKIIRYEYDPWNRVTQMILLNEANVVGYQTKYEYNSSGRLAYLDDGTGRIEYTYDVPNNKMVRSLPNGVKSTYSYDFTGHLTSLIHLDKNGVNIASYKYQYNADGRVSQAEEITSEGSQVTVYEWNSRGYLSANVLPDGQKVSYDYDSMGNRIKETSSTGITEFQYDKFNRIIKAGESEISYDSNDNINSIKNAQQEIKTKYNSSGQLVELKIPAEKVQYGLKYDASGFLNTITNGGQSTSFLPDPLSFDGAPLAKLENNKTSYFSYADNLLDCRDSTGVTNYFLEDGFKTIRWMVDAKGVIYQQYNYSAYGEIPSFTKAISNDFQKVSADNIPIAKPLSYPIQVKDSRADERKSSDPVSSILFDINTFNWRDLLTTMSTYNHQSYLDYINQPLNNWYGVYSKGTPGGAGGKPLHGQKIFNNINDLFTWIPVLDNMTPLGLTLLYIEFGPGNPQKFWGIGGHDLKTGYSWTPKAPSNMITTHSLGEISLRLAYDAGGWSKIEDLRGKTVIGAGNSPMDAGKNEVASGGYYSNFLADAVLIGLPGLLNIRTGRDLSDPGFYSWAIPGFPSQPFDNKLRGVSTVTNSAPTLIQPNPVSKSDLGRLEIDLNIGDNSGPKKVYIEKKIPLFPPDDGNGGGGGGGAGFNLPVSPLAHADDTIGGISLNTTMRLPLDFDLGSITGAVWDEKKQSLVLMGEKDTTLPSIKASDLAVALKSVYGSEQEPAFSLDAADPANPRGPYLKAVYYGPIESTHFGQAMFNADWRLKEYSFGISRDANGQEKPILSNVPGYKSIFDIKFEQPSSEEESFMRFWITCDDAPVYQKDGGLYFGPVKMKVNTEKMFLAQKGLASSNGKQDPAAEKFAAHFTAHYDEFASEDPAFAEVKELAKAVAIAKWLKQQNVPVDMDWVEKTLAKSHMDTPTQVPVLKHSQTKEYRETNRKGTTKYTRTIYLTGGVNLAVKPKYLTADKELSALLAKIKETASNLPVFDFNLGTKTLKAMSLPMAGSDVGKTEYFNQDGITYYLNDQKIDTAVDTSGNIARVSYTPDGQVQGIAWSLADGSSASARQENGRDVLLVSDTNNNIVSYKYDNNSGRLNEIDVNGKPYSRISSGKDSIEIDYDGYKETLTKNNSGTSYQMGRLDSPESLKALSLTYNEQGNPVKLSSSETGDVNFGYTGGKLSTLTTQTDKINYTYDTQDRLSKQTSDSGMSVQYNYTGDELTGIILEKEGKQAKGVFDGGCLVKTTDLAGTDTEYEYDIQGNLVKVTDNQVTLAKYAYDDNGRLTESGLPNGVRVEYSYKDNQLVSVDMFPNQTGQKPTRNEPQPINYVMLYGIAGGGLLAGTAFYLTKRMRKRKVVRIKIIKPRVRVLD